MTTYLGAINGASISDAYAEAAAYAPTHRAMLETISLSHASFDATVRIVNDHADLQARLESSDEDVLGTLVTYTALPISTQWPEESDNGQAPAFRITVDGVSGILAQQLDKALSTLDPVYMTVRLYASDDLDAPANDPPLRLVLTSCSLSDTRVTATATYGDPANRGFPGKDYTRAEYPGLAAR